jgi:hypothetical protein
MVQGPDLKGYLKMQQHPLCWSMPFAASLLFILTQEEVCHATHFQGRKLAFQHLQSVTSLLQATAKPQQVTCPHWAYQPRLCRCSFHWPQWPVSLGGSASKKAGLSEIRGRLPPNEN